LPSTPEATNGHPPLPAEMEFIPEDEVKELAELPESPATPLEEGAVHRHSFSNVDLPEWPAPPAPITEENNNTTLSTPNSPHDSYSTAPSKFKFCHFS